MFINMYIYAAEDTLFKTSWQQRPQLPFQMTVLQAPHIVYLEKPFQINFSFKNVSEKTISLHISLEREQMTGGLLGIYTAYHITLVYHNMLIYLSQLILLKLTALISKTFLFVIYSSLL